MRVGISPSDFTKHNADRPGFLGFSRPVAYFSALRRTAIHPITRESADPPINPRFRAAPNSDQHPIPIIKEFGHHGIRKTMPVQTPPSAKAARTLSGKGSRILGAQLPGR